MTGPKRSLTNSLRKDRSDTTKLEHKQNAWKRGKNPWIVTPNLNTNEKHKPFIRVKANDLWGKPVTGFSFQSLKKTEEVNEPQA